MTKGQMNVVMAGLILALLLASSPGLANQGFGHGGWRGRGHFWSGLQLSSDQKERIKNIFSSGRESIRPLREQLEGRRAALREAVTSAPFDEGRVRSLAQELSSIQTEMLVQRSRLMNDALGVLAPEQRAKLEELRQQRRQRFKEWRERRFSNPERQKS